MPELYGLVKAAFDTAGEDETVRASLPPDAGGGSAAAIVGETIAHAIGVLEDAEKSGDAQLARQAIQNLLDTFTEVMTSAQESLVTAEFAAAAESDKASEADESSENHTR
jgi:hypothetical protein